MLQVVTTSSDNFAAWSEYIRQRINFYLSTPSIRRVDLGYPWEKADNPAVIAPGGADPSEETADTQAWHKRKQEKAQARALNDFGRFAENLFEARGVFEDELSRLLYDDTLMLRLVNHRNFFGPRMYFDGVMEMLSAAPFDVSGFPNTYLGIPLIDMHIRFTTPGRAVESKLIIPEGFVYVFNAYRQYFITRDGLSFVPAEGDVIFDCGACIGDNTALFAAFAGTSGQVHAFDPIPLHTRFCALQDQRNRDTSAPIEVVNFAVGNETKELQGEAVEEIDAIEPRGLQISRFNVTTLDDYAAKQGLKRLDYIKMDVEGAEPVALAGAAGLIRDLKPKLAISSYHGLDQFWSIPLQTKELNPDYRLAFAHHSPVRQESVVYAY